MTLQIKARQLGMAQAGICQKLGFVKDPHQLGVTHDMCTIA